MATGISVVATFYNSEGTPIATGYTDPVANLVADSTTNFKVAAFDLNQTSVSPDKKIDGYNLLVQLKSPMLSGNAPVSPQLNINLKYSAKRRPNYPLRCSHRNSD